MMLISCLMWYLLISSEPLLLIKAGRLLWNSYCSLFVWRARLPDQQLSFLFSSNRLSLDKIQYCFNVPARKFVFLLLPIGLATITILIYSAAITRYLRVFMPSAAGAFCYRKVDTGSLTCTIIYMCAVHTTPRQALTCLQNVLTERNRITVHHPVASRGRTLATGVCSNEKMA